MPPLSRVARLNLAGASEIHRWRVQTYTPRNLDQALPIHISVQFNTVSIPIDHGPKNSATAQIECDRLQHCARVRNRHFGVTHCQVCVLRRLEVDDNVSRKNEGVIKNMRTQYGVPGRERAIPDRSRTCGAFDRPAPIEDPFGSQITWERALRMQSSAYQRSNWDFAGHESH